MGGVSTVLAQTNHSQHSNFTQVFNSSRSEYSDAELVLLGVAMAILVLAIVFGKLWLFRFNQMTACIWNALLQLIQFIVSNTVCFLLHRKRVGDYRHPAVSAAPDCHQSFHCLTGCCWPHHGCGCGPLWLYLHPAGSLAVRKFHVWFLDSDRCAVRDCQHRNALCDRTGPLPCHHLAAPLPNAAHQVLKRCSLASM